VTSMLRVEMTALSITATPSEPLWLVRIRARDQNHRKA
jgi:hypothetical protein